MSKQAYLESLKNLDKQFIEAFHYCYNLKIPDGFKNISDVVIAGMGGSIFGGLAVKEGFAADKLFLPVTLISDYALPEYADEKTLVICSSYSGNTEETLSIYEEAASRGCCVFGLTSGGQLADFIRQGDDRVFGYIFSNKYNPSGVPRVGIGYTIGATIGVLANLGFLDIKVTEIEDLATYVNLFINKIAAEEVLISQISLKVFEKIPVFVGAEHINAATHIWRNFYNETAKSMAFNLNLPDMNHHFLDGLEYPSHIKDTHVFVFANSTLYNERTKKRVEISRSIIKKAGIDEFSITLHGKTRIKEIFELIIIGSFISLYIAEQNNEDPSTNEKVDYLKSALDN